MSLFTKIAKGLAVSSAAFWVAGCSNGSISSETAALVETMPSAPTHAPRMTLHEIEPGDRYSLPDPTGYWRGQLVVDPKTLCYKENEFGGPYCNASNIGIAALPPNRDDFANRKTDLTETCNSDVPLTDRQRHALARMEIDAVKLGKGITWLYNYDTISNDIFVEGPFASAFSQAAIIQGLLIAYCKEPEQTKWKDLAVLAGRGMLVPIEEGGVRNGRFFEEQPLPEGYNPYILNGHLYSVAVLYELHEVTGAWEFKRAADRGVAWFKEHGHRYDLGYWTSYALRPRSPNLYMEIHFFPETEINRIDVSSGESSWSVCEEGCNNTVGDIRNGNSVTLLANLPSLRSYEIGETINLSIDYEGPAPKVFSGIPRPGINEIWESPVGLESVYMPHMGWSQLSIPYQEWHAFLVGELAKRTGDPALFETYERWSEYVSDFRFDAELKNPKLNVHTSRSISGAGHLKCDKKRRCY